MSRRPLPDEPARLFVQLANSLDRKARDRRGLVLKPWDLDPVRVPLLRSWSEIRDAVDRLDRLTRGLPRSFRRDWLTDHLPTLRGLASFVRGRTPRLPDQVREFYGFPAKPAKESELDALREDVRALLRISRGQDLRLAMEAWERERGIAQRAVLPTMRGYLRAARRDARRLFDLPHSERVRLVGTHGRSTSGVCWYTRDYRSDVHLNVDLPWTWPALRDMAAHEAYPGHHVHQATREWEYLHGDFPREAAVSLAACPMAAVEEGLAENAMRFIGWDECPEDRMTGLLTRIRWGTEVNLAWMVYREEPRRELMRYAMESGLVDWKAALRDVRYAKNRFWASYGFCYWHGAAMIQGHYERLDGDPAFFDLVYWKPHTIRTLEKALRRI